MTVAAESGAIGHAPVLAFAAGYSVLSGAIVLASPAVRSIRWHEPPQTAGLG